jgi:hypothetical protein
VKADDPRLEQSRQEMFERAAKMDALSLAVLRSHLLAEQSMGDYLLANGKKPNWVKKQNFRAKMETCKRFAKEDGANELWGVLNAANQLRNKIAHTLLSDKIAGKMKQLKDRYLACLTAKQAADLALQSDDYIAQSACLTCAGFIVTLTDQLARKSADVAAT